MKGNVALFCIILIIISSVSEIKAMFKINCGGCENNGRVSESPRQTFHPQKVTSY